MNRLILGIALAISMPSLAQNGPGMPLPLEDGKMDAYLQNRQAPVLKVSVINSQKKLVGLQVRYTIVHSGSEMQETGNTYLDDAGETQIVLRENLPYQQVWLSVDSLYYAGLLINSDLTVKIDAGVAKKEVFLSGKGVSLTGPDAALNEQLMQRALYKRKEQSALQNRLVDASISAANNQMPVPSFLTIADSVLMIQQKLDNAFLKDHPGFEWAVENERDSYFYEWFIVAFNNKDIPDQWMKRIREHRPYFTSNEGVAFYRSLSSHLAFKNKRDPKSIQDELYKNSSGLNAEKKGLLDSITFYEAATRENPHSEDLKRLYAKRSKLFRSELDKLDFEQSLLSIQQHSEGSRADILKMGLMERWKDKFEYVYPELIQSVKTTWVKQFIQSKFDQASANKKQVEDLFKTASVTKQTDGYYIGKPLGELSFGAELYMLDSIPEIGDFIVNLRASCKNKALVLDIWATWCAPCIADIPYSKKLHEENTELPIEYVYLCTTSGSDEETWKKRIGTMKPPGKHIFIDESLLNALRKMLNAEGGFPTYVVIDREGKVNAKAISFMSTLTREQLKTATGIQE